MDKQTLAENIVEKMRGDDAYSRWLGIELKELKPGFVRLEVIVRPEMLNSFSVSHGGVAFSLADSAMAYASNSRGKVALAMENNISFIRKVNEGDRLTATTRELSLGRTVGVYRVTVQRQDGDTVGLFRGTVFRTAEDHFPE